MTITKYNPTTTNTTNPTNNNNQYNTNNQFPKKIKLYDRTRKYLT